MSKKNKQKQPQNYQWIQLEEINPPKNKNNDYIKLNNQETTQNNLDSNNIQNKSSKTGNIPSKIPKKQQEPRPNYNQPPPKQRQETIRLNGNVYSPRQQSQQQPKRSKIPTMNVACDYCTLQQNVPGNAQIYACSACGNMNQCYPLYGIFICGHCKTQVCYPFGTSQFIRCTRCGVVNKVPIQPITNYKKQFIKKQPQSYLDEMRQYTQAAYLPTKPKEDIKQEQILLEDVSFPENSDLLDINQPPKKQQFFYPKID